MESLYGSRGLSFVDVTNGREAHPKSWVAVLVQMNTEKKVGEKLSKLGIENYVPTQSEIHQWSDRKKKVERIVIPMVVFAFINKSQEGQIKTFSYIHKFLSYPGEREVAVIPKEQIERLKYMLSNADSKVELFNSDLELGEDVEVIKGPLKGLSGKLFYFNQERPMVGIRLDSLGCACVNVNKCDVISKTK